MLHKGLDVLMNDIPRRGYAGMRRLLEGGSKERDLASVQSSDTKGGVA